MPVEDIIVRRISGIRPFNELPIDAEKWREAHNHHHLHRYFHALTAHRPGIVTGLEVVASKSRERTIVVAPGVAVDSNGQTIVLREAVTLEIAEARTSYILLSYQLTRDKNSAVTVGGGQQHYREVEGYELKPVREIPATAYVELARIYRSGADKGIKDAANPFDPGNDELNMLYRPVAFPHCYADVAVGELSYVGKSEPAAWKPNRGGLWNLLRDGNGSGFHLDYTGVINLRAEASGRAPALLYVAGKQGFQPLADAEIDGLKNFLNGGGLLFGEAAGGNDDFAKGFQELAGKLGAKLKKVGKGHPLLTAHNVFPAPPAGAHAKGGDLLIDEEAGVLFGARDYGSAWQGEIDNAESLDAREHVRAAQEFGLNIIAYAANRKRLRELSRLG